MIKKKRYLNWGAGTLNSFGEPEGHICKVNVHLFSFSVFHDFWAYSEGCKFFHTHPEDDAMSCSEVGDSKPNGVELFSHGLCCFFCVKSFFCLLFFFYSMYLFYLELFFFFNLDAVSILSLSSVINFSPLRHSSHAFTPLFIGRCVLWL